MEAADDVISGQNVNAVYRYQLVKFEFAGLIRLQEIRKYHNLSLRRRRPGRRTTTIALGANVSRFA